MSSAAAHAPLRHRKEFRQAKSGAGQHICAASTPRAQPTRRRGIAKSFARQKAEAVHLHSLGFWGFSG